MTHTNLDGLLLVLNGPTSTGKTTAARTLQERTDAPLFRFSTDDLLHGFPDASKEDRGAVVSTAFPICVNAVRDTVFDVAARGNIVVTDVVWQEGAADQTEWARRARIRGVKMVTVGFSTDEHVVRERIAKRDDRHFWMYEFQAERVHAGVEYDATVNTARHNPQEVSDLLLTVIAQQCTDSLELSPAFHKLSDQ